MTGNYAYWRDGRFEFHGYSARTECIPELIRGEEERGWYLDRIEPMNQTGREDERYLVFYR